MTNTTTKKGAVKGTVAAAAGIAVLLGGAGTFALWNDSGAIGSGASGTGELSAEFGSTTWQDETTGAANSIANIGEFKMVPGDVVVGTAPVTVDAQGENLKVNMALKTAEGALPADVDAEVKLMNGDAEVTQLTGSNTGTKYDLSAIVTLTFDPNSEGSMTEPINLGGITVDLQQVVNS